MDKINMKNNKLLYLIIVLSIFIFSGCMNSTIAVIDQPIDVSIQDYTGEIVDMKLVKYLGNVTLSQKLTQGDRYVQFVAGHGLVKGDVLNIFCENRLVQNNVENVNVNNITLAIRSDINCETGTTIKKGTSKANTIGTLSNPELFCLDLTGYDGISFDITRMIIFIQDNSPMDSSLFGGLNKLTYPVSYVIYDGMIKNLFAAAANGAFELRSYDVSYSDKAPAGFYGVRIRKSFNGQDKNGAVLRIHGRDNDKICLENVVDLTGLTDYQNVVQGHYVTD